MATKNPTRTLAERAEKKIMLSDEEVQELIASGRITEKSGGGFESDYMSQNEVAERLGRSKSTVSLAVQSKKVGLVAMDNTMQTKASADEVALASKGFNEQVEKEFKSKNKNVDFAWVDRMLKISVSPSELREFLQKGKLAEFGGGR